MPGPFSRDGGARSGRVRARLDIDRYSFPALVTWPEEASLHVTTGGTTEEIVWATHGFSASAPRENLG
jgi:hypothetical protein